MKQIKLTKILFIIYLIALVEIILFKLQVPFTETFISRSINIIPFYETLEVNEKISFSDIVDNILIFIPVGVYLKMIYQNKKIKNLVLYGFVISLILEISQFILGIGASDITDLITNTTGVFIGVTIYGGLLKLYKNDMKLMKHLNIIASIGTVLLIALLLIVLGV